ncbi:hypothetical protein FXO38_22110 [Capsicum annuum]|nr:hypothetical protein FXO38_22110 [Capsicum annuum]KAF3643680.1 hypothetical protein FXO37_21855 [Capsicum annuum]
MVSGLGEGGDCFGPGHDYGVYGFIDGSYTCPEPTMGDEDGSSVQNPAFQQGQIDSVILLWMQDMILRQIRQEIILIKSKRGHTAALKPDLVTVAIVLSVCGKLKVLKQGKEIHAYAVKNGFVPNASVSTRLMMMYSQCGLLQHSSRVFDIMENRNVIAWTLMSYIDAGCLEEAIGVFRSIQLPKHRTDAVAMGRILAN